MSGVVRIVVNVARAWVRFYTSRMPPELRVIRRAEIDSDLWAHHKDAVEEGLPPLITALQMLLRIWLGVLDDLSWCVEARQPTLRGGMTPMVFSPRQARWMGISSVAGGAIALLMFGIVPILTDYFASVGIPLPLPTRIVMGMSASLTAYWWAYAAVGVALFLIVGQLSGSLRHTVLANGDGEHSAEADTAAEARLSRIEPIMIVGLGVVVGAMVLSLFLPIFDVVNATK